MKFPKVSHALLACASLLMCNLGWASAPWTTMSISPDSLSVNVLQGQTAVRTITISNTGPTYSLDWGITEGACGSTTDYNWISDVSPFSGSIPAGGNTSVFVTFDTTLSPSTYTGNLCVTGNSPQSPIQIPVTLTIQSANQPPDCSSASPSTMVIWPPNHNFVDVQVLGVTDPDGDPVTITIDSIYQDEEVNARGSGNTTPDGSGVGTSTAAVRAERYGRGNGRVYTISFTAEDGMGGQCTGDVKVSVPHDQSGAPAVDEGPLYDSTITP